MITPRLSPWGLIMRIAYIAASLAALVWSSPSFAQVSATSLIGTYTVTGTETDGRKYDSAGVVVVTMDRSGALDIKWDGGAYVGVGQVMGNVLAIGSVAEGRVVVGLMDIKPDGSLEGRWWRRTDAGTKGTEVWKKK
jgi:hypothetical protein